MAHAYKAVKRCWHEARVGTQEKADRRARLAAAQQPPLFQRLAQADAERDTAVRAA